MPVGRLAIGKIGEIKPMKEMETFRGKEIWEHWGNLERLLFIWVAGKREAEGDGERNQGLVDMEQ